MTMSQGCRPSLSLTSEAGCVRDRRLPLKLQRVCAWLLEWPSVHRDTFRCHPVITPLGTAEISLAQGCPPYWGNTGCLGNENKADEDDDVGPCAFGRVRLHGRLHGCVRLTPSPGKTQRDHHNSSHVSFPSSYFKMKVFNTNAAKWALC